MDGSYSSFKEVIDRVWKRVEERKEKAVNGGKKITTSKDPTEDSPWSFGALCDYMAQGVSELNTNLSNLKDWTTVAEIEAYYIPYGPVPPSGEWNTEGTLEATNVIKLIQAGHRQSLFKNTRVDNTVRHIARDFLAEKQGKIFSTDVRAFRFVPYPFKIEKGSEITPLAKKYVEMGVTSKKEIRARAMRDYFCSAYLWQFLKGFTLKNLSISAAITSFAIFADFMGAADGPDYGGIETYANVIADGLNFIGNKNYVIATDHVVFTSSFMRYKIQTIEQVLAGGFQFNIFENKPSPTPFDFFEARWWDACLAPWFKIPIVLANGTSGVPVDSEWSPIGTKNCCAIRKAVDMTIRGNEILDVSSDEMTGELFNEVTVAARYGGLPAVINYAEACASVIDDVAGCPCGDLSHDWATDNAAGISAWAIFCVRYNALTQLNEIAHLTTSKFSTLLAESNHGAFITSRIAVLENYGMLHDNNWAPMYKVIYAEPYTCGNCEHCEVLGKWLVNRCLYRDDREGKGVAIRNLVKTQIHLSSSREMTGFWEAVVRIAAGDTEPADILELCINLIKRIWKTLRNTIEKQLDLDELRAQVVNINVAVDMALAKTHKIPNGHTIRRAIIGALSAMVDRTDIAVYQRLLGGMITYSQDQVNNNC